MMVLDFVDIPVGQYVNEIMNWMIRYLSPIFDAVKSAVAYVLNQIETLLVAVPWPIVVLIVAAIVWRTTGWKAALLSMAGLYLVGGMGLWREAMATLALMITSVMLAILIGVPLGILCAYSDRVLSVVRPLLDVMQTMPAFVYLVPALMFFGIGKVPAVFATIVFASPPAVRLTNLGIRQVPQEVVEATQSFGATTWQLLFKVHLPLAKASIMAGVNQTIMLSLSMSVLAAMIAAGGLGQEVLRGLSQVNLGSAFEAGLSIVVIAMILDRMSQSINRKKRPSTAKTA